MQCIVDLLFNIPVCRLVRYDQPGLIQGRNKLGINGQCFACYSVPLKEWKECRNAALSMLPYKGGFFTSTGRQVLFQSLGKFILL